MSEKHVDPKDAKIAALEAQLAGVGKTEAEKTADFLAQRQVLAEEHKGTKTYVVGHSKHYRNGKLYQAGELVTVTDERPAKDWVLADKAEKPAKAAHAPVAGRASDRNVGG